MPGTERVIAFSQLAVKGLISRWSQLKFFFLVTVVPADYAMLRQQNLSQPNFFAVKSCLLRYFRQQVVTVHLFFNAFADYIIFGQ
jgi:hypothetical protein